MAAEYNATMSHMSRKVVLLACVLHTFLLGMTTLTSLGVCYAGRALQV